MDDDLGVGYGHGIVIFGSFVTVGDARTLLEEKPNQELAKTVEQRARDLTANQEDRSQTAVSVGLTASAGSQEPGQGDNIRQGADSDDTSGDDDDTLSAVSRYLQEVLHDGLTDGDK